ncbi:unnamed protein product [Arctia plantaginis]|uniref:Uncharacterized protein n=1 Tax=Arctia plantaginis TaxID=874455 RepID=A0A8S1B1A1_ARCPL|nr:unnamed protein product [Arctia plantaginis]
MSVEPDKSAGCPTECDKCSIECGDCFKTVDNAGNEKKKTRSVRFPDEDELVTQYFEPANPWQNEAFINDFGDEFKAVCINKHKILANASSFPSIVFFV